MRNIIHVLTLLFGTFLIGIAYNCFFMPAHLVSGGVGGIALLLWQIFGWPVGLQMMILNIPILWFGGKYLGKRFLMLTILGILSLSLFNSILPIHPVVGDDPMLTAIFGGILAGAGIALTLRAGGSTGGLDIAMVALNQRFSLPMGDVILVCNGIIVAMAGVQGDLKIVLYTLIGMFVSGKMVDLMTSGSVKKTLLIVTSNATEVAQRINTDMRRGVTVMDAKGAYSGADRNLLLCAVTRYEVTQIKDIVREVDPCAFVVVLETDQVVGRFHGYNPLSRMAKTSD